MDKGNSGKNESPTVKKEEKEDEEEAGPSKPPEDSKTMQRVEVTLKDDESAIEAIRRYMAEKLGFAEGKKGEDSKKKEIFQVLDEVSVAGIVRFIQSGQCRKIVVMAGAGISTSAGIPDFRSPGSGLYDNLTKYKLPHPQCLRRLLRFVINQNSRLIFNDVRNLSEIKFASEMKSLGLPSGQKMPVMGLGTWQAKPEVVEEAVRWALETGYRLIDTAFNYGNEEAIGKAIEGWIKNGGKREDLFITTKLPNFGNRPSEVNKYLQESLKRLRLQYLDLYLVHHPFGFLEPPSGVDPPKIDMGTDHLAVWKEMENAVHAGFVKNIGLSNFNRKQIEKIASNAKIQPANLQVEIHAYLQQPELVNACKKMNITVTAYAPLGSPSAKAHFKNKYDFQPNEIPDSLTEPRVLDIARNVQKTPAQVLLRFLTQTGIAVVPKSSSRERIKENFEALNFDLKEEEMENLKSLDRGERGRLFDFLFYKGVENHPEYPFEKKSTS